jgi:hypothetical protein
MYLPLYLPPSPREISPRIHWIGDWVHPRASLDDMKKKKFLILPGLELISWPSSL